MMASALAFPAPLSLGQFAPHGVCYAWTSELVWLHVVSDLLTVAAYFSIPWMLLVLWRRRRADLPFHWMFVSFAMFILACGATHALEVWNIWHADYWISGGAKAVTAIASVTTAVALVRLLPTLSRLPSPADIEAVNRELSAANARLQASQEMFRAFMDNSPLRCWMTDADGVYRYSNRTNERFFQVEGGLVGKRLEAVFSEEMAARFREEDRTVLAANGRAVEMDVQIGQSHFRVCKFPLHADDGTWRVGGIALDVTEQRRTLADLQEKSELLGSVTETLRVYLDQGDWKTAHGLLLKCALRVTESEFGLVAVVVGGSRLRVLAHEGMRWQGEEERAWLGEVVRDDAEHGYFEVTNLDSVLGRVVTSGEVATEQELKTRGAVAESRRTMKAFLGVPVRCGREVVGVIAVANRRGGYDASTQGQLEMLVQQAGVLCDSYRRDLRESALAEQVRVSQKMEAIGLLAGGVAHDFNNLLQVIQGYTSIALDAATPPTERQASLEQVKGAGQRAAQLTQQLLAFSRQQRLQKADLDLNQAIKDLLRMLARLIGEHIAVDFIPGHDLGNVFADRAQVDQVLLNLCLNARDAMPNGGRITIETENVLVNGRFQESHPWAKPGRYVLVSVTDNGIGMDKETQARIFEPFFSTKAKDRGTGLGLAVVYGVVKQHDGMVHVYSECGKGTTFKVYLPIVGRMAAEVGPKHVPAVRRGTETILLAEDDPLVRDLASRILKRAGYHVLVANDGAEACSVFAEQAADVSLMVLDVVMPHLGGPDAYQRMSQQRPGIPVVFCSGYAGSALEGYRFDAPGMRLLPKPYGADEILLAVREALDRAVKN